MGAPESPQTSQNNGTSRHFCLTAFWVVMRVVLVFARRMFNGEYSKLKSGRDDR